MKRIILAMSILVLALTAIPAAATENQAASRKAGQKDHEESMEEQFRKLGRELDLLKARIGPMTEQASKEIKRYKGEAEKRQKQTAARLEELRKTAEKKWKELSDELNAAIAELERSLERAKPDDKP